MCGSLHVFRLLCQSPLDQAVASTLPPSNMTQSEPLYTQAEAAAAPGGCGSSRHSSSLRHTHTHITTHTCEKKKPQCCYMNVKRVISSVSEIQYKVVERESRACMFLSNPEASHQAPPRNASYPTSESPMYSADSPQDQKAALYPIPASCFHPAAALLGARGWTSGLTPNIQS